MELISEGGFGYVWKARVVTTGQLVAVKKMHLQSPESVAQADWEIQVMRALKGHDNVVSLLAASRQQGQCIMVMELCSGGSLFDLMEEYIT